MRMSQNSAGIVKYWVIRYPNAGKLKRQQKQVIKKIRKRKGIKMVMNEENEIGRDNITEGQKTNKEQADNYNIK